MLYVTPLHLKKRVKSLCLKPPFSKGRAWCFNSSRNSLRSSASLKFFGSAFSFSGTFFVSYNLDRKSTRLNSSHVKISYAVFCLKKKKKHNIQKIIKIL